MEAVNASTGNGVGIYVKSGVYHEKVVIPKEKLNLKLTGDGMGQTIISGNNSVHGNQTISTHDTATLDVRGDGFFLEDLTIENTAGPSQGQAVAMVSQSNLSVYHKVQFRGHQDTLYVYQGKQFYKECEIAGTVDFVFGMGTAVFQHCSISITDALPGQSNTITAHRRDAPNEHSGGFSFQFCKIFSMTSKVQDTYLGRPWGIYAITVFMESYLPDFIKAEGWLYWNDNRTVDRLYYGEYNNTGPGASLAGRVNWTGFHSMTEVEAQRFTVSDLIDGDSWLPATGVNYTSGLGLTPTRTLSADEFGTKVDGSDDSQVFIREWTRSCSNNMEHPCHEEIKLQNVA